MEQALPGVFELELAFAPWILGQDAFTRLNAPHEVKPGFSLLRHLGFTGEEIQEANDVIVGRMTVEGAPHLREEHYPVFDCAKPMWPKRQAVSAALCAPADDGGGGSHSCRERSPRR